MGSGQPHARLRAQEIGLQQQREWNDTTRPYPRQMPIHRLFERQAAANPDAVAVDYGGEALSYLELERRANRLARALGAAGIGPGERVATLAERSPEMIVAFLGILKAGAAYVPLDPAYPAERLDFMLRDAGASAVLVQEPLRARLGAQPACPVMELESLQRQSERRQSSPPAAFADGSSLAYVMYTSGSTGKPKGVCVPHRAISRLVLNTNYVTIGPGDRVAQVANASFDAATFEIWGALLNGARLVGIARDCVLSPAGFAARLSADRVGFMFLTAALFNQMIRHDPGCLSGIGTLLVGGEALNAEWIRRCLRGGRPARLLNGYGPTENTTFSAFFAIDDLADDAGSVPIGRPIANSGLFVLDGGLQPVAAGEIGDLYAGGDGLATGYWNRPRLTAERFIPHPWSDIAGERLYATGDLARRREDGVVEFLGRADTQVKLHGYRIELGEIEAVLANHPAVAEAAVVLDQHEAGDGRLVAYWVASQGAEEDEVGAGAPDPDDDAVAHWETLFDEAYNRSSREADPTFDITGWNSSYTGFALGAEEMREWVDDTLERIGVAEGQRVLEIGCGTGLLLFRLARSCSRYCGTDFSTRALEHIQRHRDALGGAAERVSLLRRRADDFTGIAPGSFDIVILNSIVQYFPNVEYLVRVLAGAIEAVGEGGTVFVGDVRSLPLLEAFHASLELFHAPATASCETLRRRIGRRVSGEPELAIDPAFFPAVAGHLATIGPAVRELRIEPKKGRHRNEMNSFRYDVTLRVGGSPGAPGPVPEGLDWQREGFDLAALRRRLAARRPGALHLSRVPNARVAEEVGALELLESGAAPRTVGELREALRARQGTGVDPADLWDAARELSYAADIRWVGGRDGSYDVLLTRRDSGGETAAQGLAPLAETSPRPWDAYANQPLRARFARQLVPRLRAHLERRLPRYMMPAHFLLLDALPLTPNGKLDRAALPSPEIVKPDLRVPYTAPAGPFEEALVEIAADLLRIQDIGVHDDLLELGARSLQLVHLQSEVRQRLGVDLPLAAIFATPTVAALAAVLEQSREPSAASAWEAIPRSPESAHYPLSHAQRRLWFLTQLDPADPAFNVLCALVLRGRCEAAVLGRALTRLVARHEPLRTALRMEGTEPVQEVRPARDVFLPLLDLSRLPAARAEAEAARLAANLALLPFALETGLLLRAQLVRLARRHHQLLLCVPHATIDGWSIPVLVADLASLYGTELGGEEPRLPPLPVRYVDYARWQRQRIAAGSLAADERFWLERLGDKPPRLALPTDHPPASSRTYTTHTEVLATSAAMVDRLRRLDRQLTLFMVLLALVKTFLLRITGGEDITVGVPAAGREHPDTGTLVGLFMNALALRTDLGGEPTFTQLADRVRQAALEAYAHQHYPFDLLVERLNPRRDSVLTPLFDVLFGTTEPVPVETSAGLAISARVAPLMPFAVDLNLGFQEEEGGGVRWLLLYRAERFEHATAQRLTRWLETLIGQVVEHPETPVTRLDLLTPAERQELTLRRVPPRLFYPLSFHQRDIWFQCELYPRTPYYNCCITLALSGPLEPGSFQRALSHTVARHEVLRASFPLLGGQPVQRVATEVNVHCAMVDLSQPGPALRAAALAQWEASLACEPFDLAQPPLLRMSLARLAAKEFRLCAVVHHLLVDALDLVELLRQTLTAYAGFQHGRAEPLPPLPVQYPDFAAWQGTRRARGALLLQRAYWHRQLRGALPGLQLPPDRPLPPARSFAAAELTHWISGSRLDLLRRLKSEARTTLFRTVLAALNLLLSRLTGERGVVLALPARNRPAELDPAVIGHFANALPLRADLRGDPRMSVFLRHLDATVREALRFADYPIEEVIASLEPRRDASRPLLPICVSQVRPLGGGEYAGLSVFATGDIYSPGIVFDLWLLVSEEEQGLKLHLKYNRDLYDGSTIERLMDGLETLLQGLAADPEARASQLETLPSAARGQLLAAGSPPEAVPFDRPAHQLFAAQAQLRPDAVAAVCGEARLSYSDLNAAANRLAHWLRRRGVGRGGRVGLFGERGLGMLTATLAVLKAGAAFVPLDPEHPDARLGLILGTAAVSWIATRKTLEERVAGIAAAAGLSPGILCWDAQEAAGVAGMPASDPPCATSGHDLANVFFTSGSTGLPKGVMVEHAGMLNHLRAKIGLLRLGVDSVVAQNASHCFDISVWQMLAPLVTGGRTAIYDDDTALAPHALLHALERDGVTVLETVPSLLEVLLEAVALEDPRQAIQLPRLAFLISNAETLPLPLARRWLDRFPHVALVNTYGTTECSDDTNHHVLTVAPPRDALRVAVGRPIPGARIYVLDDRLQLLPAGFGGQIATGGTAVGRGYLEDPGRTAEIYVPDPFAGEPGSRMYLSGDLGRWARSGELEFIGRLDHQVKIRGQRVEPGEAAAALARHPDVRQAAVVVRPGPRRDSRLVAYWVGEDLAPAELRSFIEGLVPRSMVPEAFVRLPVLPLTRNGKLDVAALPEPEEQRAQEADAAPQSALEAEIAEVWQEVLQVARVGTHDNFFDLGGDSILSIVMVARLHQRMIHTTPRALFEHQTVAELARVAGVATVAEPAPARGRFPLLPIQELFFGQRLAVPEHFNQALLLEAGHLVTAHLEQALQALLDHHEALRLRFVEVGGEWLQEIGPPGERVAFEVVELEQLAGLPLHSALNRIQTSLDLARGPVFRAAQLRAPGGGERLLLVAHHLVVDLVSWRILLADLEQAYEQALAGRRVVLSARTTNLREWSEALRRYASGLGDDAVAYWLSQLPPEAAGPAMGEEPGEGTWGASGEVRVRLGAAATRDLASAARQAYRGDLSALLLTAFARALGEWSGQREVSLLLEGHGRETVVAGMDLSRTVGWFTSVYPHRLETGPGLDAGEHLERVAAGLRSVAHGGIEYGLLRHLQRHPALRQRREGEVSFNYHGRRDGLETGSRFRPSAGPVGVERSPRNRRAVRLAIECGLAAGRLEIEASYSRRHSKREAVVRLTQRFLAALRELAGACRALAAGRPGAPLTSQPAGGVDAYPLAPIQEGLLFHALHEPEAPLYFEQGQFTVDGPLAVDLYARAWEHVVTLHPILRTVFQWEDVEQPVQVALAHQPLAMKVEDLRGSGSAEQQRRIETYLEQDWSRPFPLDRGPLQRLALFCLEEERFHLVWSFHHILLDAWSVTIVQGDVAATYEALLAGRPAPAATSPPFRDYLEWLAAQDRSAAVSFWRRELEGWSKATPLPWDRRPAGPRQRRVGQTRAELSAEVTAKLMEWARRRRVTLSSLLRAMWGMLLGAMSGEGDVVFGATVSGRPPQLPGVERIVGPFINAVPVRVGLHGSEPVAALVARLHARSVAASAYEFVALSEVQQALGVAARGGLFDSLLIYENYPLAARYRSLGGARIETTGTPPESSHYDLIVTGAVFNGQLALSVAYACDLFDLATAERLRASLETFLAGLAAHPEAQVGELATLPEVERQELRGRLDRWAEAPAPAAQPERGVAPRTELEAAVAEVWRQVLGVDRVGVTDSFFELGGHSLSAIRLVAHLRSRLGLEVSIRQLLLAPTVAALAEAAMARQETAARDRPIRRLPDLPHHPLSPQQRVQWLGYQVVRDEELRLPPRLLRLRGALEVEALTAALRTVVDRHETLRTSFVETSEGVVQTIWPQAPLRVPLHDLAAHAPEHRAALQERLLSAEMEAPLDLSRPPLLRVELIRLEEREHLLLLRLPHAVADGWGEDLLLEELGELYSARLAGRPAELPPLPVRYVDFVAWQSERMQTPELQAQLGFWLQQFAGGAPELALPVDREAAAAALQSRSRYQILTLSSELSAAVRRLAAARDTTLFVVLLAALKVLLARVSGQTDVVVATPGTGRSHPDLERVLGLFLNPLALRSDLGDDPSFVAVVEQVRQTTAAALNHQDYPFESWLEVWRRRLGRSDAMPYSVLFSWQENLFTCRFTGLEVGFEAAGGEAEPPAGALPPGQQLSLEVLEEGPGLSLYLLGDPARFAPATLGRWLVQLRRILEQVAAEPQLRLGEIDLLGDDERRLVAGFSRGDARTQPPPELLELARRFCAGGCRGVAVRCGDGEVVWDGSAGLLDPIELLAFLGRRQATALAAPAQVLAGIDACLAAGFQTVPALEKVVCCGSLPRASESAELGKHGSLVAFFPCGGSPGAGLWVEVDGGSDTPGPVAGRPASDYPLHVLDRWRQPVPATVIGDVYATALPTRWRGRWLPEGRLEVAAMEPAEALASRPAPRPRGQPYFAPRSALEQRIAAAFRAVLNVEEVGIQDDFFALGGKGEEAVEVCRRLGAANVLAFPQQIERLPTIAALAQAVETQRGLAKVPVAVPLTPLQQALLAAALAEPSHGLTCAVLRRRAGVDPTALVAALSAVVRQHDALRFRCERHGSWWQPLFDPAAPPPALHTLDLSQRPVNERRDSFWRAVHDAGRRLSAPVAPFCAVLACGWGDGWDRLALVASALAVDSASWTTLAADLDDAYGGVLMESHRGGPSFQGWLAAAPRLAAYREPPGPPVHGQPGEGQAPRRSGTPPFVCSLDGAAGERLRNLPAREAELLLAAALARVLDAGAVALEATRRCAAPELPGLERTVGQFGALRPRPGVAGESGAGLRVHLCLLPPAAAPERGFCLEEIMPPPLPSGLAAEAPDLHAVAWDDGAAFRLALTPHHAWPRGLDISRVAERLHEELAGSGAVYDPVPFRFGLAPEDLDELLD